MLKNMKFFKKFISLFLLNYGFIALFFISMSQAMDLPKEEEISFLSLKVADITSIKIGDLINNSWLVEQVVIALNKLNKDLCKSNTRGLLHVINLLKCQHKNVIFDLNKISLPNILCSSNLNGIFEIKTINKRILSISLKEPYRKYSECKKEIEKIMEESGEAISPLLTSKLLSKIDSSRKTKSVHLTSSERKYLDFIFTYRYLFFEYSDSLEVCAKEWDNIEK